MPLGSLDPQQSLKEAMTRRLFTRSVVSGEVTLPAVPSMIDEYVSMCANLFATVGRTFSDEELAHVRMVLEGQLAEAYAASPRSSIVISYNAPIGPTLHYQVEPRWWTVEAAYEDWISTREPPLFGTEPDARVWALANDAAEPGTHRVLEIGAGTGRNALALARRGHPVDVVEMTPYDYERANLPDGAWPPTSWYANWVSGLDVFPVEREMSPIEMRWLVFQKRR